MESTSGVHLPYTSALPKVAPKLLLTFFSDMSSSFCPPVSISEHQASNYPAAPPSCAWGMAPFSNDQIKYYREPQAAETDSLTFFICVFLHRHSVACNRGLCMGHSSILCSDRISSDQPGIRHVY